MFTLVVDILTRIMSRGSERRLVSGLKMGMYGVEISHLQLADDMLSYLRVRRISLTFFLFYRFLSLHLDSG